MKSQPSLTLIMCVLLGACSQMPSAKSSVLGSAQVLKSAKPAQAYAIDHKKSLHGLILLMERNHPALVAADAEAARLRHQAKVAGALPDPKMKVGVGSLAETAAGRVNGVVGVEQQLPYPGKRSLRRDKVLRMADAAAAQRGVLKVQLSYQLRLAYWRYYEQVNTRKLLRENQELLKQLADSVQARVEANKAQAQELIRLTNEIGKVEREILLLGKEEASTKSSMNALLHRPPRASLPWPRYDQSELKVTRSAAVTDHPELKRGRSMIAAARNEQKLAKLAPKPDFSVGVQYADVDGGGLAPSANGRDQVMATFGVTLPLWRDKNEASRNAAAANLVKYRSQLQTTRSLLESEKLAAFSDIRAQEQVVDLFRKQLIPDSQSAFDLTAASYASGKADFNDLIDAWRHLLSQQKLQVKNQSALGAAVARYKKSTAR